MKKLSKNQQGFVVVEGLLILVIVAIIGGVGWYVVKSKNDTNKTLDTSTKSFDNVAQKTEAYKFTELDVQFTLPNERKDLSHKVVELQDERGRPVDVVYLYDANLVNLAKQCADSAHQKYDKESTNIAALVRGEGTYKEVAFSTSVLLKQFGGFHVTISYPNGSACYAENQLLNQKWNVNVVDSQKTFEKAFKTTASEIK